MGKLLIYKSGKVKMKIGETLFEVNRGARCLFHQELVSISHKEQQCFSLGDVNKKLVCTLDVDHALHQLKSKQ